MSIFGISDILSAASDEVAADLSPARHVACISILEDESVEVDSLKSQGTFTEPRLNVNLKEGFPQYRRRHSGNQVSGHPLPLDRILQAILTAGRRVDLQSAQVVTWRGILIKLCSSKKTTLDVQYYRSVLYIQEHDPNPDKLEGIHAGSYEGHRFESLCTTGTAVDMNINNRWYSVALRDIGNLKLLFAGEVDCVKPWPDGSSSLLELKSTTREHARDENTLLIKWFWQSFLLGVPEIFVGYREGGFLRRTESLNVDDIPDLIRHNGNTYFDVQAQLNSFQRILAAIRNHCIAAQQLGESHEGDVWRVSLNHRVRPARAVSLDMERLGEDDVLKINKGQEERLGMLPSWYVDHLPVK
jgi:RAT1-interacting protein